MHYATEKEVWNKLHVIHEGRTKEDCSSKEPTGNLISKKNNDASKDEQVTDSKNDKIYEVLNLRIKLDLALQNIINLKDKLQEYDNRDHIKSVNTVVESKQYCEGLEAEIVSLKEDLGIQTSEMKNYFKHLKNRRMR